MNSENQLLSRLPQLILEAEERCRPYLWETPLEYSPELSRHCGGEVWLKLDMVQRTTSFKIRGALNKIRSLTDDELQAGVLTASTGNFAFAVAEAIRPFGVSATTYVGNNISPDRLSAMQAQGLDVVCFGDEAGAAEQQARTVAEREGRTYVSPYNDPLIVAGQGTCAVEMTRQWPQVDTAVIAVGGGGLISGCGAWLKHHHPALVLHGVSPVNSPVMERSVAKGQVVSIDTYPTLADTCAGGIDADAITLPLCANLIDRFSLADEPMIESGIRFLFEQHRLVAEGSAAMGVGMVLQHPDWFADRKTVLVVCGRNIDLSKFKDIVGIAQPTPGS